MGGKRTIQGYKSIFCSAGCLMLMLLWGCQYTGVSGLPLTGAEGRASLEAAHTHAQKGDFTAASASNQAAHEQFPAGLKQGAILQKGLLYLHPENPDQSMEKGRVCLDLIDQAPDPAVVALNAELTLLVLRDRIREALKADQDIRKNRRQMAADKKKIQALLKEQDTLKKYIKKLRAQINQLKEIDLSAGQKIQGIFYE